MNEPKYTEMQMKHTECLATMSGKIDQILALLLENKQAIADLSDRVDVLEENQTRVKSWIAGAVVVLTGAIEIIRWLWEK